MSIAPFSSYPAHASTDAQGGFWRTRLVVAMVAIGITATIFAYAISPSLRHAVSHAERSVGHAVSRVFDHDAARKQAQQVKAHKKALVRKARANTRPPSSSRSSSTHTGSTH